MVPQFCKKDQIYNQVDIKVILESFELSEKILAFLRQSITRLTYVKQECAGPTLTTNAKTIQWDLQFKFITIDDFYLFLCQR